MSSLQIYAVGYGGVGIKCIFETDYRRIDGEYIVLRHKTTATITASSSSSPSPSTELFSCVSRRDKISSFTGMNCWTKNSHGTRKKWVKNPQVLSHFPWLHSFKQFLHQNGLQGTVGDILVTGNGRDLFYSPERIVVKLGICLSDRTVL